MKKIVTVNDLMQQDYSYELVAKEGDLPDNFRPNVTPAQMLALGVFGGKYMCDCRAEFPEWFDDAILSPAGRRKELNYFGENASLPLTEWIEKGWLHEDDPRGWFQWYCRFYKGRRHEDDARQIKRWTQIWRHLAGLIKACDVNDVTQRPRARQALLHWGVLVDGTEPVESLVKRFGK